MTLIYWWLTKFLAISGPKFKMVALFMERCCWEDHNADWANWGNNQHSEDRSQISYSSLIYLEANFLLSHFSNYKKVIWNLEKKENHWKLVKELVELAVVLTHYIASICIYKKVSKKCYIILYACEWIHSTEVQSFGKSTI